MRNALKVVQRTIESIRKFDSYSCHGDILDTQSPPNFPWHVSNKPTKIVINNILELINTYTTRKLITFAGSGNAVYFLYGLRGEK